MAHDKEKLYEFAPLGEYSLKDRLAIRIVDWGCFVVMRLIGATIRFEVEGWENYEKVIADGRLPIWTFWHEQVFLSALYFQDRGIVVMVSKSKDGEYISRILNRFGIGTIRGSSSRGGARALIEMKRAMGRDLAMAFTVDGPRGPRRIVKPGPAYLAKLTGNSILLYHLQAKSRWTLKTWDRLQVPKPFSRALLTVAPPIAVPADATEGVIEQKVAEMQATLDSLVRRGLEWSGRSE